MKDQQGVEFGVGDIVQTAIVGRRPRVGLVRRFVVNEAQRVYRLAAATRYNDETHDELWDACDVIVVMRCDGARP